jgi:hypothetical protein
MIREKFRVMNFKLIIEGWANYLRDRFDLLEESTKILAHSRIEICDTCEVREGRSCSPSKTTKHVITEELVRGCGCNIAAKAMAQESKCPAGKW